MGKLYKGALDMTDAQLNKLSVVEKVTLQYWTISRHFHCVATEEEGVISVAKAIKILNGAIKTAKENSKDWKVCPLLEILLSWIINGGKKVTKSNSKSR